jgi:hypothetical protein
MTNGAGGPGGPAAPAARRALATGVVVTLLYMAGATLSGRAGPLTRRPLLDGLAPPAPYRWVHPPAALAAGNKRPAGVRFPLKLTARGSALSAFSTPDGQVNLVMGEGAVPSRPGQTQVVVTVQPLDPARLPAPPGLLVAGNAYRVLASYRPSGRPVTAFGGQSSVGLVYPLLSEPLADPAGHLVVLSTDGRGWQRLASTDAPGTHQVSAPLLRAGDLEVAVAPAPATPGGGRNRTAVLLAATAGAAVLVLAAWAARGLFPGGQAAGRSRPAGGPAARGPAGRRRPGPPRAKGRPRPARRRRRR